MSPPIGRARINLQTEETNFAGTTTNKFELSIALIMNSNSSKENVLVGKIHKRWLMTFQDKLNKKVDKMLIVNI